MPLTIGWSEVALRLILAAASAALIGWDRGEHGKTAGVRTILLVGLAAALAMIEVNLLLDTRNKPLDSFIQLDLMRLPLGILSGMGFIGAGAIIRRSDMAVGVTTAATLWFVTVVGLCFGAGSIGLGLVATALGYAILTALKQLELRLPSAHRLAVAVTIEGRDDAALRHALSREARYRLVERGSAWRSAEACCEFQYELGWRAPADAGAPTALLGQLASLPGVVQFNWRMLPP